VLHAAYEALNEFRNQTPPRIQRVLAMVETKIRQERKAIHDWEIDAKIDNWVANIGKSRERETKYMKTIELYWYIKTFMGNILLDNEEEKGEITKHLAEVWKQLQGIKECMEAQDNKAEAQLNNSSKPQQQELHEGEGGLSTN